MSTPADSTAWGGDAVAAAPPDPTACVPKRCIAYAIDAAILTVPTVVVFAVLVLPAMQAYLASVRQAAETGAQFPMFGLLPTLLLANAATVAINFVYFAGFEAIWSTTPGKAIFGLVVVAPDGTTPIGPAKAAIRDLLLVLVDGFPIGLIVALVTKGHQRVGDLVSGCYVVAKADANRFGEIWPPDGVPPWKRPIVPPYVPGVAGASASGVAAAGAGLDAPQPLGEREDETPPRPLGDPPGR